MRLILNLLSFALVLGLCYASMALWHFEYYGVSLISWCATIASSIWLTYLWSFRSAKRFLHVRNFDLEFVQTAVVCRYDPSIKLESREDGSGAENGAGPSGLWGMVFWGMLSPP